MNLSTQDEYNVMKVRDGCNIRHEVDMTITCGIHVMKLRGEYSRHKIYSTKPYRIHVMKLRNEYTIRY